MYCWGSNAEGQIGGSAINTAVPTPLSDLSVITAVATGQAHSCALGAGGGVFCWGSNSHGQLGDGSTTGRSTPSVVEGLGGSAMQVIAGHRHSCARLEAGTVQCWGANSDGQLGDGSLMDQVRPVLVSGLTTVVDIAAGGAYTCALLEGGDVTCWGANAWGQLGDGTTDGHRDPAPVTDIGDAVAISATTLHTCALVSDQTLRCWGRNAHGQLGDGGMDNALVPIEVPGLSDVVEVVAGDEHTCALTTGGAVSCWGWNDFGQLGDGMTAERRTPAPVLVRRTPAPVVELSGANGLAVGWSHTCSLHDGGTLRCWGRNGSGELGDGLAGEDRLLPTLVVAPP